MQAGGGEEPTRVRYGSRKAARKARRAVRRGETPPDPYAMPTPKPKRKARIKAKSSFIEPNKELRFGGIKKYQGAGPVIEKKDPMTGRDVASGDVAVTGGTGRAVPSNPVTGMSPRQRAQNTPQGSSQKTKQGESVYTESTMDRIGRATVPPGSKKGDGKSTTSKLLDKLGNTGGGGKSTKGGKATKVETDTKPKTETKKTSGSSSFGKAFAAARKEGKFTFKWNGKTYGTRRSGETIEQHRRAMKKAGGDTPAKSKTTTTETKPTPSSTPKTETKSETKTETTTPKAETKTETPTTPPDRRTSRKEGKQQRKDLKGQIKEARKQKRARGVVKRQGKKIGRLQEKLQKIQSRRSGGGMMKYKPGGFPDLTGDGKVTRADILKGRGVIKKNGGKR